MSSWNTYDIGLPRIISWQGEGIFSAGINSSWTARKILESGLPAITVENELADHLPAQPNGQDNIATVRTDSPSAGRIAAEYFLEQGFRHFAFCGVPDKSWSQQRKEGFCQRIQEAKLKCHIYPEPLLKKDNIWEKEKAALADWLNDLPKPVGLMACNDERSCELIEAANLAGVAIPEEISLIGVDNDELICNLSEPALSSIAFNTEKAGYEAAQLLDRLMDGEKMAGQKVIVETVGVVARKSTDVSAIPDSAVVAAIRFIQAHSAQMIRVDDVVNATPLSRRLVERRFRKTVGRSILNEIQRVHVESAAETLLKTDLPITQVAQKSGFSSATHLGVIFKQRMKMTPLAYRKAFKNGQI
jgi:LacI family transcriptional regulator